MSNNGLIIEIMDLSHIHLAVKMSVVNVFFYISIMKKKYLQRDSQIFLTKNILLTKYLDMVRYLKKNCKSFRSVVKAVL